MNQPPKPGQFDAVLGGTGNHAPEFAAVLGGIEALLRAYGSPDPKIRTKAISQALRYGDEGVNLLVQTLKTDKSNNVKNLAYDLLLSRDDKSIQVIEALRAYELSPWQLQYTISAHSNWVNSVAFSPHGRILASGSRDNSIKLWDVATRSNIASLTGHSNVVNSVAFSLDGRTLASGSWDRTIKLWDVATGGEIASLTAHSFGVSSVVFSPDGRTLASSGDETIKLWDVATGGEIAALSGHSFGVNSVAFSPDGRTLASGSGDKTIKIWQRR